MDLYDKNQLVELDSAFAFAFLLLPNRILVACASAFAFGGFALLLELGFT